LLVVRDAFIVILRPHRPAARLLSRQANDRDDPGIVVGSVMKPSTPRSAQVRST